MHVRTTTVKAVAAALALVLVGVAGCSGGSGGDGGPCAFENRSAGATAQFHADASCATNPFPDDRLRNGDALALPVSRFSYLLDENDEALDTARAYISSIAAGIDTDGFSTVAPIVISLNKEVDLATVPDGVQLYRFTGATPALDATVLTPTWEADRSTLLLQQRTPLAEATTYGVVVTAELLDLGGRPTARARDFQALLSTTPSAELTALVDAAVSAGTSSDAIALAFTFRTQTITADLLSIRDQIFGATTLGSSLDIAYQDPSAIPDAIEGAFSSGETGFTSSLAAVGIAGTNLAMIFNGSYASYDFRGTDKKGFDPPHVDGTTTPPTARLLIRGTIPEGTMPAGGWPVVIYGHGLGGKNDDVYKWGDKIAPHGFAMVGITAAEHIPRGQVITFFDWDSMPGTRESLRQTTADQLQMLRALRDAKAAGLAPYTDLNLQEVSYLGISLGGIMGSSFLALAPDVKRGALVVPGGHLSYELYAEEVATSYLWPFISSRSGLQPTDAAWMPFLKNFEHLIQIGLDAGDPLNYAPHVVTPGNQLPGVTGSRPVLMLESEGDNWVPNIANEALREALGIPILTAPVNDGAGVSGMWLYREEDFSDVHPEIVGTEPHGYISALCEAQLQVWHWLETEGTDVIDPVGQFCQ